MDTRTLKLSDASGPAQVAFVLNAEEAHVHEHGEKTERLRQYEMLLRMAADVMNMVHETTGRTKLTIHVMDEADHVLAVYNLGYHDGRLQGPSVN